jgi:hypothetical protein
MQEPGIKEPRDRSFCSATPRKQFAKAAHTSVLNKVLVSSVSTNNTSAIRKVDFMREHNGNMVVIREVKSGKYNRVSEVKCESVQARIRKLQFHGTKSLFKCNILSPVGYFYGGDCEVYCILACDSSVESSMIVVEEKLHGGKIVCCMGKGEQNETDQEVYPVLSAPGVQNTNHFYALQPC